METQKTKEEALKLTDFDTLIFKSPSAEYTPEHEIGIESISIDDYYTRIDFTYLSPKNYPNGGWVQIYSTAFIRPSGSDK